MNAAANLLSTGNSQVLSKGCAGEVCKTILSWFVLHDEVVAYRMLSKLGLILARSVGYGASLPSIHERVLLISLPAIQNMKENVCHELTY